MIFRPQICQVNSLITRDKLRSLYKTITNCTHCDRLRALQKIRFDSNIFACLKKSRNRMIVICKPKALQQSAKNVMTTVAKIQLNLLLFVVFEKQKRVTREKCKRPLAAAAAKEKAFSLPKDQANALKLSILPVSTFFCSLSRVESILHKFYPDLFMALPVIELGLKMCTFEVLHFHPRSSVALCQIQ